MGCWLLVFSYRLTILTTRLCRLADSPTRPYSPTRRNDTPLTSDGYLAGFVRFSLAKDGTWIDDLTCCPPRSRRLEMRSLRSMSWSAVYATSAMSPSAVWRRRSYSDPETRQAAAAGGRGRRRQDRNRQGARRPAADAADSPAVLRGTRRGHGDLRMGLPAPDALSAHASRRPAARAGRPCGTISSPRSSCSSGRCCRRSTPRTSGPRCCSSTRSTAPTRSWRRFCWSSSPISRSPCPRSARSAPSTSPW